MKQNNFTFIFFVFVLLLQSCTSSTESNDTQGEILGNVVMASTSNVPPKPVAITLFKWKPDLTIDSIALFYSDNNGKFIFTRLDTGEYIIRTNVNDFYKTGFAYYVHLSADNLVSRITVSIDTSGTGCYVGFAP